MVFHLFERFFGTFGAPKDRIWGSSTKAHLVNLPLYHLLNISRLKMDSLKKKLQILHGSMAKKITGNLLVSQFYVIIPKNFQVYLEVSGLSGLESQSGPK